MVVINEELQQHAPQLRVGVVRAAITPGVPHPELAQGIADVAAFFPMTVRSEMRDLPEIAALHEVMHRVETPQAQRYGLQERAINAALRRDPIALTGTASDVAQLLALQTRHPVFIADADALSGPMRMRFGGREEYCRRCVDSTFPIERLPVLADDHGVFGGPTFLAESVAVTPSTEQVAVVVMAFDGRGLDRALQITEVMLESYCGAPREVIDITTSHAIDLTAAPVGR